MAVFYDDLGRDWEILITPRTMFRLKQLTQGHRDVMGEIVFMEPFDLANAMTNNAMTMLADIYPRTIVVYLLCKKQADERGVLEGDFLDAMLQEKSIAGMTNALFAAIGDSFPNVQMRELARKIQAGEETYANAVTSVYDKILAKIEIVPGALSEEEINQAIEKAWG
ncbi:MAG: hypothetical protein FWD31_13675 [Planctomycetaceae bacterium]|nr:hypothetical protein [Planctomycetaceae bacterium]